MHYTWRKNKLSINRPMYKVLVTIQASSIDGKGVFAQQDIEKDTIVWQFDARHDHAITQADFDAKDPVEKEYLHRIAYLSPWSNLWVYPPKGDPAEYTNHSNDNNLTVTFDGSVSSEPYFIANRAISTGEELTNNYHEFDVITKTTQPDWARR